MTSPVLLLAATLIILSTAALLFILPRLDRRGSRESRPTHRTGPRPAGPEAAIPGTPAGSRSAPEPSSQSAGRLDLSVLPEAPCATETGSERLLSESRMSEIRTLAEKISQQIQARQGLIDALSDSPEDPGELTRAVTQDPALAGQILKTVNSSTYGLREPLASVFRAVLYLGHLEVRNIIWKVCFADAVWMTPSAEDSAMLDAFWAHSFQTSRLAYAAGKKLGLANPDVLATSALLHDIGKLLAWQLWPEEARGIYQSMAFSDAACTEREWNDLGIDHTVLGAETVGIWKLPQEVRMVVEHHHAPSYRSPDFFGPAATHIMVVHLANLLSHLSAGEVEGSDVLPYKPQAGWWERLDIGDPGTFCSAILRKAHRPGQGTGRAA